MAETKHWLFKCNVKFDTFADLLAKADRPYPWHGVRNYNSYCCFAPLAWLVVFLMAGIVSKWAF